MLTWKGMNPEPGVALEIWNNILFKQQAINLAGLISVALKGDTMSGPSSPLTVHPGVWGPVEGTLTSRHRPLWGEAIGTTVNVSPPCPLFSLFTSHSRARLFVGITHPLFGGPFSNYFCMPTQSLAERLQVLLGKYSVLCFCFHSNG